MSKYFTNTKAFKLGEADNYGFTIEGDLPDRLEVFVVTEYKGARDIYEGAANMLKATGEMLTCNMKDSKVTTDGINEHYATAMRDLGQLAQYMVNCASYHAEDVMSYDVDTIERRCNRLISALKSGEAQL